MTNWNLAEESATESELTFTFHAPWRKMDDKSVPAGLMSVDFIVDAAKVLYLIEVKNFEQSKAPDKNRERDYKKITDPLALYPMEMGMKAKDSLLRMFANAESFSKPVKFVLLSKHSKLEPQDLLNQREWLKGYIPTGLKESPNFTSIDFAVMDLQAFSLVDEVDVSA
jgi:hypothetical protein